MAHGTMEPGSRMTDDAVAATTLPATAAETSPDNPWPLQLLSQKLKMHIDRAPSAWVEGQVIELNRRGTNAYLTLRDIDAEISLPASIWTNVLDRQDAPLERGSRVVALLKAEFWLKTGRLSMSVKDIRPVGLGDLLARIERLRQALAAEGLFADSRKLKASPAPPPDRPDHRARLRCQERRACATPRSAGPPSNSKSGKWRSRATRP